MSGNQPDDSGTGLVAAPLPAPEKPVRSSVEQMFDSAVTLHMAGREAEAEALYLAILAVPPTQAETSYNLGLLYQTKGRKLEAIAAYRNATLMRQDHVSAYCNMATALQDLGQTDVAIATYKKAIAIQPEFAMAYCNLGVALKEDKQLTTAAEAYQRAITIKPDYDWAHANLSAVLMDLDDVEGSILSCNRALALNDKMNMAYFNLGAAYKATNRHEPAIAAFREAIRIAPNFVEAHFTLSQVLLQLGQFEEGWQEYEWRWKLKQYVWLENLHGEIRQPLWQGENIAGKTLMIYAEQGLGDAIQYLRYLPMVRDRTGANIVLAVHPPLRQLVSRNTDALVVTLDQQWPDFDYHCPLLTLPRLFGTNLTNIPADIPYLKADPAEVKRWGQRIGETGGNKKVGIVWAGNPEQTGDRLRSPRLEAVHKLFDLKNITFIAVQLGAGRKDIADYPLPDNVIDLGPEISDFSDTAAIMSNLDLMVTSCTAPLHLSAALGVPTWAMIPFAPHFLWMDNRTDSPWYPTLRLFRQSHYGKDWSDVIGAISAALQDLGR